jgi:ligand-binding sensor domain-containing protein
MAVGVLIQCYIIAHGEEYPMNRSYLWIVCCLAFAGSILFSSCSGPIFGTESAIDPLSDSDKAGSLINSNNLSTTSESIVSQEASLTPTSAATLSPEVTYPSGWTTYTDANNITDLVFDQSGYLWVSSKGGVTRWNLLSNTNERYTVSDGLPSNNVSTIYAAQDGKIWIGTEHGQIADFDGSHWTMHEVPELSFRMKVTDILQDQKGNIWFSTHGAGAIVFDGKEWKVYLLEDGLASVAINGITEDAEGNLWFETFVPCCDWLDTRNVHRQTGERAKMVPGITRYRNGSWVIIDQEFGLDGCCMVNHIARTSTGLWIGPCYEGDFCVFNGDRLSRYPSKSNLKYGYQEIFVDNDDNVWYLTNGNGITRFDGNQWDSLLVTDLNSALPTLSISDLEVDSNGILWLATFSGIVRFDSNTWDVTNTDNGLPDSNDVRTIAVSDNHQLWIGNNYWPEPLGSGNQSSILFFDGRAWTHHEDSQGHEYLGIAGDGSIWAKDFQEVYRYSNGQWKMYQAGDQYPSQLLLAPDDAVWLVGGIGPGVFKLENDRWLSSYTGNVVTMAIAPDGTPWLAESIYSEKDSQGNVRTIGISLKSYDGDQWIQQTMFPGEAEINGKCMAFSSDGSLWICTHGWDLDDYGLFRFHFGQWIRYTSKDGLSGDFVSAIYPAVDGSIWFVTEGGITRFSNLGN